jgi:hypothetical protein
MNSKVVKISGGLLAGVLAPCLAHACACGCGFFDVGGSSMLPSGEGGMAWTQFDYVNQNQNFAGTSRSSPDNNDDKRLQSEFTSVGVQYMFNSDWGIMGQLPYTFRYFKGTDEDTGNIEAHAWSGLGDIRINAIYTGFSDDLSTGLTLGVKLPTGRYDVDANLVDRDTQIGTGSTDALFGLFHRGKLGRHTRLEWFAQGQMQVPFLTQAHYRPGLEFNMATGIDYTGYSIGSARIVPLAQVLFSEHTSDYGANADSDNTGYQRVYLSPGLEVHIHPVRFYADVEFPIYQNYTGNQLAAPALFKFSVSYMF